MANVSSWAEIVAAISGATGDITLNLTKNINLVAEVDYVYGVQPISIPDGCDLTINGNGYQIINLSNDINTSGGIFKTNANTASSVELNSVDFVNLVLNNAALVQSQNASDELEVINCGFEGKRNGTSYLFDVPAAHFTGCFFNIPWIGTGQQPNKYTSLVTNPSSSSDSTNYTAEYCWFREHYTNWDSSVGWSCTYVNQNDRSTLWSFYFIKLNGCYIDGDMTMGNDTHTDHTSCFPIDVVHHANRTVYTPTKMSVFDVTITVVGNGSTVERGSFFGLYINKAYKNHTLLTTWKIAYSTNDYSSYPLPIIASEEQASDSVWLDEHGFAI